ncbi:hypothetical protein MMC19_007422 [Ptychographa xylographoides]|nr:hypothetical protein [Ptychographa xylographoides]
MIGRLLQSAASTFSQNSSSRPQTPLESITEEAHTRDLLYPDVNILRQSGGPVQHGRLPANAREAADYDDRGNLDIKHPSDVRIIIAQDANSRYQQPQVLYDSKPTQSLSISGAGSPLLERESTGSALGSSAWTNATTSSPPPPRRFHASRSSMSQIAPSSPTSPRSAESRFRSFQSDTRPRLSPFEPPMHEAETTQGKMAREAKEETDGLLSCMFGAPGFRIEPGTKLHILPRAIPEAVNTTHEIPNTIRPLSSSGFARKRTPLVRSTTSADILDEHITSTGSHERLLSGNQRSSIMFTRLFSVLLPESSSVDDEGINDTSDQSSSLYVDNSGSPRASSIKNVKQKKVPMYAVAIIIQIPVEGQQTRTKTSGQHHALSSLGSSYNEVTPGASWNTDHSVFSKYMESRNVRSLSGGETSLNVHITQILARWTVISRSLEVLGTVAKIRLRDLLERSIPLAPLISAAPVKSESQKAKKRKQPMQQSIHVTPGCLQSYSCIQLEAEKTGHRIVVGLRTRRVATGQGRWGAWREEARWVGRWAGGRDQNFFFFNLMTAFLGYSTSWLEPFAHSYLKRRIGPRVSTNDRNENQLRQRTVIISADKMAARRLLFLLSAFLPTSHVLAHLPLPMLANPPAVYSESPPPISVQRERSNQQSVNGGRTSVSAIGSHRNSHGRSVSFSLMGTAGESDVYDVIAADAVDRRMLDTRAPRSNSLAITTGIGESRKASTSTIIAESALPVPHFASLTMNPATVDTEGPRPGSSGSLASIALNQSLKRSDSSALSTSGSAGRWGSVVSGFWSTRRDSSTDDSEALGTSQDGVADFRKSRKGGKLAQMVEEVIKSPILEAADERKSVHKSHTKPILLEDALKSNHKMTQTGSSAAKNIRRRSKVEKMPLKMSFNEDDGFIDIDMPQLRSFSSSMESSFNSTRLALTGSYHEHYSPYGFVSPTNSHQNKDDSPTDVAGWLKGYHPDFTLQAVRPYKTLKDDIKDSMRTEARLAHDTAYSGTICVSSDWAVVGTTLVADTTNFSIIRLVLRQRKAPQAQSLAVPKVYHKKASSKTDKRGDYTTTHDEVEEMFTEELVMDMDPTLIDAVERVLAQSSPSSRVPSRAPSPSRAASVRTTSRAGSIHDGILRSSNVENLNLELPNTECKKMVLGALEEVVRSVFAEQHESQERDRDGTRPSKEKDMPDSTLREGVRRWLSEIEGDAW